MFISKIQKSIRNLERPGVLFTYINNLGANIYNYGRRETLSVLYSTYNII